MFDDADRWLQISAAPAVWTWCKPQDKFFDFRMTALRLTDGTLLVYSPVPNTGEPCLAQLATFGDVSCLLAPSHFHNLGLRPFASRWPKARLVAPPPAIPRLRKVTGLDFATVQTIKKALPPGIELTQTDGLKGPEVWIKITANDGSLRALVVCDAFFHMNKPKRGFFALMLRLVGGAPGLRVSRMFKRVAGMNRETYGRWARQELSAFRPTMLIPAHGEICVDEALPTRLEALL